jgi:hypothetical protein
LWYNLLFCEESAKAKEEGEEGNNKLRRKEGFDTGSTAKLEGIQNLTVRRIPELFQAVIEIPSCVAKLTSG